jgi:hypothetical protein
MMCGINLFCSQPENQLSEQFDLGFISPTAFAAGSDKTGLSSNESSSSGGTEYSGDPTVADTFSEASRTRVADVVSTLGKLGLRDCDEGGITSGNARGGGRDDVSIESLVTLVRALKEKNTELESKIEVLEEINRPNAQPSVDDEMLWQEIGDLRAQVADLKEVKGRLGEKAGELAEERDVLRAQLKGKAEVESQLRETKSKLSQELAASKEQCTALQTDCENLRTFALLGVHVRSRLLEWEHPRASQNEDLIDAGSRGAHYGMCHADALLYSDTITALLPEVKVRRDNEVYRNLYGIDPAMMLNYQENRKLMEAFDLRCTMKRFLISETYETSRFRAYWKEAWAKVRTREDMSVEGLKGLLEKPEMEILWAKMRAEYENADMLNKKKRLEAKLEARRGK